MSITKQSIKDAMRSIVRIQDGKIFGDSEQEEFWNNCDKDNHSDEWKELYEQYQDNESLARE